jgi:membrane-bound lytic murein transglycosylase D
VYKNIFLSLAVLLAGAFAMGWTEPKILNVTENDETEPVTTDAVVTEGEQIEVIQEKLVMKNKRPWQAPNYAGQENALGWRPDVFEVPAGLRTRVDFWKDIYTKYSTDQGILHDSLHVGVVYAEIDFRSIMKDGNLTDRQKQKARRILVEDKKKEVRERLTKLAGVSSASDLSGEDLRIWNLFSTFTEPNKFKDAAHKKRLRFQLGQSDRFLQGIYYSGRYLAEMENIFRQNGIPIELTRLPFVESSFNVKARSRVGASGIWQFMRYTGRRFMRINYAVDERNEPLRATEAAAKLFRLNYSMLNQWPLAVTGYNHGPAGVQRVVKKFNTDNIVDLVDERHGRFGFASANFYACFLAALEVEKNANKYFANQAQWDLPYETQKIQLTRNINKTLLLKWFQGNQDYAKEVNAHVQRSFWLGYAHLTTKEFIRVPKDQYAVAIEDLKSLPVIPAATVAQGEQYYVIAPGETLSEIASQLGVSAHLLRELNGIDNPRRLRPGQKILIPKGKAN